MPDPTDEPLDELPAIRSTEVRRVRGTTTLWRLYSMVDHPLPWNAFRHWGPASARWDPHPQGEPREHRDRAVHYSATSIVTALAEVFQQHRTIICAPGMRLVGYRLGRGVRMLDANGRWFTRAGASQSVVYGDPMRTQRWAAAITAATRTWTVLRTARNWIRSRRAWRCGFPRRMHWNRRRRCWICPSTPLT